MPDKLIQLIARICSWVFLAVVLAALAVVVVLPRAVHGQAMTVLTASMTPGIPVGSLVIVRPVDPGTLEVGDVATYQAVPNEPVYVTHRVESVDADPESPRFTFKGDANRGPDKDPVKPEQIVGEVWFHVPYLGAARDALDGAAGLTAAVVAGLVLYAMSQLAGAFRARRRDAEGVDGGVAPLIVDRAVVLAVLPVERADHLVVPQHARLPVRADDETVTYLYAAPPQELETLLRELGELGAVSRRVLTRGPGALEITPLGTVDVQSAASKTKPPEPTDAFV